VVAGNDDSGVKTANVPCRVGAGRWTPTNTGPGCVTWIRYQGRAVMAGFLAWIVPEKRLRASHQDDDDLVIWWTVDLEQQVRVTDNFLVSVPSIDYVSA